MIHPGKMLETQGARLRVAFWGGAGLGVLLLVYLARAQPSWPWFSLWLVTLLGGLGVLSLPRVRKALNLSWFAVTLLILTGVSFCDLYLFHVETHRQRSERLEVRGVYLSPRRQPIRVGVGYPGLDVRLEGSLYEMDRWALDLRRMDDGSLSIDHLDQVDMLRLPEKVWWKPWGRVNRPAIGARLGPGSWTVQDTIEGGTGVHLELLREGRRGTLEWDGNRAPLSLEDPLLDRRLSRRLARGVPLSDLEWDSLPDRRAAEDLVLTLTRPGLQVGRVRLSMPEYRLVSLRAGEALGLAVHPHVSRGDTVWVTSRGKAWAFTLEPVPGVSRVAAPTGILFVRRPRPDGWALPSSEVCGEETSRCAVLSSRTLPPPQPHFDLGGFGLDTARYSLLARLETGREGVRVVGADFETSFPYGQTEAIPALAASGGARSGAGILVRVHRANQGRQAAVLVTILGLFVLMMGTLMTVSGDPVIWARRKTTSPSMSAAWAFVNVFLIFLGVRLALGLRIAYSPPFYDRGADTAVGLWITFALMLVALGRWPVWAPWFWRAVRRLERPLSRMFLPGVNGSSRASEGPRRPPMASRVGDPAGPSDRTREDRRALRRGRMRSLLGLVLMASSVGLLLWQRPGAAPSLLVAATGIGAWLAMGIARRRGDQAALDSYPLSVIAAEGKQEDPALSLALAAGGSVVLALAIHAPWMALVPVLALVLLFGLNRVLGLWPSVAQSRRRVWILLAAIFLGLEAGVWALAPFPRQVAAVLLVAGLASALVLRASRNEEGTLLDRAYQGFLAVGQAVFSGVGWIGVLLVLGLLAFLSAQAIPPFVRFALVFMLFLLAIRAGLTCRRVLELPSRRGRVQALGLLVIPLGVLLVFMLFDFGLGLVFFVPMFLTVLLSARIDRLPKLLGGGSLAAAGVIALLAWSVLNPPLTDLRNAPDLPTFSAEFRGVGNGLVDLLRRVGMDGPVTRASVRSIAATDPDLLEEALAFAGPGEALFAAAPSRDQVWGGRAYAASGLTGTGFAGTAALGRGVPTAVSYAENAFSVYVLSEHGALGGVAVLLLYLSLLVVVGVWIVRVHRTVQETREGLAVLALTVGGVLWLTLPAVYVAASNLALVPLTGQNMPFLGLNSWADVVLVSGLATGIVFGLAALGDAHEEGPSLAGRESPRRVP